MGIYTALPIYLVLDCWLASTYHRLGIVWLFGQEQLKGSFQDLINR
jgi:hypothetical protein